MAVAEALVAAVLTAGALFVVLVVHTRARVVVILVERVPLREQMRGVFERSGQPRHEAEQQSHREEHQAHEERMAAARGTRSVPSVDGRNRKQ